MAYSGIYVDGYVGCTGCVDGRASVFILNFSLLGCNETYWYIAYVYTDIRRTCNVQHCSVGG